MSPAPRDGNLKPGPAAPPDQRHQLGSVDFKECEKRGVPRQAPQPELLGR